MSSVPKPEKAERDSAPQSTKVWGGAGWTKGPVKGGVSPGEVEQIRQIESARKACGYDFGWTYHQAAERRLLLAYEHTLGGYRDGRSHYYAPLRGRALRDPDPLLTAELVPETCFFKSVRQRVVKEFGRDLWDSIRLSVSEDADRRCEVCLGRGRKYSVGCHGVFEYDDYSGIQTLTGFVALCPLCAEARHIGLSALKGRYEAALKRLMMINRWTKEESYAYLERVEAVHERRSVVEWKQDFTLAEYSEATGSAEQTKGPKKLRD